MIQAALNFESPRSRRTDPKSSRRAEDQMRRSGALRGQAMIVLDLVKQFPGKTSKELGNLGSLDRHAVARRLPDLLKAKLVRRTEEGSNDCQWWAV